MGEAWYHLMAVFCSSQIAAEMILDPWVGENGTSCSVWSPKCCRALLEGFCPSLLSFEQDLCGRDRDRDSVLLLASPAVANYLVQTSWFVLGGFSVGFQPHSQVSLVHFTSGVRFTSFPSISSALYQWGASGK